MIASLGQFRLLSRMRFPGLLKMRRLPVLPCFRPGTRLHNCVAWAGIYALLAAVDGNVTVSAGARMHHKRMVTTLCRQEQCQRRMQPLKSSAWRYVQPTTSLQCDPIRLLLLIRQQRYLCSMDSGFSRVIGATGPVSAGAGAHRVPTCSSAALKSLLMSRTALALCKVQTPLQYQLLVYAITATETYSTFVMFEDKRG